MRPNCFIAVLVALFFFGKTVAQVQTPVKWEGTYNPIDENYGELIIKAKINVEWHIYSQMQTGDGPLPTVFYFERTPDYDLVNGVAEPTPETAYSDVFSEDVMMFSNEVTFKQKIKRSNKKSFTLMGNVECMACNNSSCLPPKKYTLTIQVPSAD
jgi:thiol:disulfide interchange protein DsbD